MKRALLLAVLAVTSIPRAILAQTATPTAVPAGVLNTEGIAGDVDKHRRSPVLSVQPITGTSGVKILVDAYVADTDYTKYPIRIDFFVNRKLFSSQIRSPELPGALGIDISKDVVAPPFNYTVVATVLHPNSSFTTVLQGAVFNSNLSATLDCTLTAPDSAGDPAIFVANGVSTTQEGNSSFRLSFTGSDQDTQSSATLSTTVTTSGTSASATLSIIQDGATTTPATTGTITSADGKLTALSLESSDGNTSLSCS